MICFLKIILCFISIFTLSACSSGNGSQIGNRSQNSVLREGKPIQDHTKSPVLLVTHPTRSFDTNAVAKPVISAILRKYLEDSRSHYVMTTDPGSASYYPEDYKRSNKYISLSGAHALMFMFADTFIVTGGNLLWCLCETVRDTILGSHVAPPITFKFVADAIYMAGPNGDGTWGKSNEQRTTELFSKFLANFSDDYLVRFVETEILHNDVLCDQNPFPPYTLLRKSDLTIEVRRRGVLLKTIGNGSYFVVFDFTDYANLQIN